MTRKYSHDELRAMLEDMLEMDPPVLPEVMVMVLERTGAPIADQLEAASMLVLELVGSPEKAVDAVVAQLEKRRRARQ
jgi:hypothetical protein